MNYPRFFSGSLLPQVFQWLVTPFYYTQNNEKYLPEGRNPLACSPACLLALCQLRNFLCEFTEKCVLPILTNQAA